MTTLNLMNEIDSRIDSGEEILRYKQLKTSLNQLKKNGLIDDSNIDDIFNDQSKLDEMNDAYTEINRKAGKKDLRTPKTHVRNLASFYVAVFNFDADGMTFSDALKAAVHRKYDNVYEGTISKKDRVKIKSKYRTYHEIAVLIVKDGIEKNPELWPTVITNSSARINRYIKATGRPGERTPIERIEHIEDFLTVPRGTFTNKLNLLPRGLYKKKPRSPRKDHEERKVALKLNAELSAYIEEYSDFRIYGNEPKVKFIPPEFIGREHHCSVHENYKKKWTVRARSNDCSSKNIFTDQIRAFATFCAKELEMNPESITLEHLTSIDILEKWKNKVIKDGSGGHACKGLLQVIKKSVGFTGYLRLCGAPGSRSIDSFNAELNILPSLVDKWSPFLEDAIKKKDSKKNIRFLLEMTSDDMWNCIDEAIQAAFDFANKIIMHPINNNAEAAYHRTQALTVMYLSRLSPIRSGNWTDLRFNEVHNDFSYDVPSLTWYKNKNSYRLFVPTSFLKNESRSGIKPIDVYYPESHNNVIKKHLFYRQKYIDIVINKNGEFNHNPERFCVKLDENPKKTDPDNKFEDDASFGPRFKRGTKIAFEDSHAGYNGIGINHHATRHLAATWYLNENPKDFAGLSTLLNDSFEIVVRDYAEVNDKLSQERINKAVESKKSIIKV